MRHRAGGYCDIAGLRHMRETLCHGDSLLLQECLDGVLYHVRVGVIGHLEVDPEAAVVMYLAAGKLTRT